MSFADTLIRLRKKEKLTQKELGEAIGVSKGAVSMYERGQRVPEWETLEAIADYFNVDMDYLYGRAYMDTSKKPSRHEGEQAVLNTYFSQLTPENRAKLLELCHLYLTAQSKKEEKQ